MTANQIAAGVLAESARHNVENEKETKRHNERTEDLQDELNELTRTHQSESRRLQEEYNTVSLAIAKATEEDKVELETRKHDIEELIANNNAWYQREQSNINWASQKVDELYKNAMAKVSQFSADIEAKRAYYEQQKTEAYVYSEFEKWNYNYKQLSQELAVAKMNYDANIKRINNDYELGRISNAAKLQEVDLANRKFLEDVNRFSNVYKPQEESKTKLLEEQSKTEKSKRSNLTSSTVKNYADIPAGVIDSVMPF